MGYLHEVETFMNFTNGPMSRENLCWAVAKVQLWVHGMQAMSND